MIDSKHHVAGVVNYRDAVGGKNMRSLTTEQERQFQEDGFLAYGPFLRPERVK